MSNVVELFRTKRLAFRTHEARDEAPFVAMHTDDEVRRFAGGAAWSPAKARERFLTQYLGKPSELYGLWAAVLIESGKYIGMCGITQAEGDAHLAYYLARQYWRKGLATEAAQAFVALAKDRLALDELYADVETGHAASEHILRKLGFTWIGHTFIEASGRDISRYRLALH
ncbi:MAG TPA: GNAT family N-acetyltransferase [Candidatus Aquilonibacter sp.]